MLANRISSALHFFLVTPATLTGAHRCNNTTFLQNLPDTIPIMDLIGAKAPNNVAPLVYKRSFSCNNSSSKEYILSGPDRPAQSPN